MMPIFTSKFFLEIFDKISAEKNLIQKEQGDNSIPLMSIDLFSNSGKLFKVCARLDKRNIWHLIVLNYHIMLFHSSMNNQK